MSSELTGRSSILTPSFSSVASLACALVICFSVAALGAKVTVPEIPTWYASLAKPSWTPPRIAFPIVWPILYFLMAVAAWRLWEAPPSSLRALALTAFVLQLSLNAIWSPLFFGRHNLQAGGHNCCKRQGRYCRRRVASTVSGLDPFCGCPKCAHLVPELMPKPGAGRQKRIRALTNKEI
jgi:hypothetical protein